MATTRTNPKSTRMSLDRSIERMRKQLAELAQFLGKGKPACSLEEFDLETERLISDLLGQASDLLHAYEYAELGEVGGLVNMTDEAPEGAGRHRDGQPSAESLTAVSGVGKLCVGARSASGYRAETEESWPDSHWPANRRAYVDGSPESLTRGHSARSGAAHAEVEARLTPPNRQPVMRRPHHGFGVGA